MIKLNNLSFAYGKKHIFGGFSLEIPDGARSCIFGGSGCGKTTLLRLITGLEEPADGSIETGGVRFSAVFQEDRLLPFKTVLENITLIGAEKETAAGMGGAVVFVITIASFVAGLLYKFILVPTHFEYLKTIVFILVIAALVQIVEMFLKKFVPSLYKALGVYLPLITTNCAVLGVALNNVKYEYSILESVVNGFATGVGYLIAIVLLAGIREKMEYNDIPESFQGMPIVLLTAALMAIAFFGFSGIV